MKKIKLSLAALTLVVAIAGTTSVNANKVKSDIPLCSEVEPGACPNESQPACCFDESTSETLNDRARPH